MSAALTRTSDFEAIERVLVDGDLSPLTPQQRVQYYNLTCESVGLNPLTKPFEYIRLNGKLVMYARKDCTDQLRSIRRVSIRIASREVINEVYVVTASAALPDGRADESTGAVAIASLKGENLANAYMKAETKAKRRATLSICGLGMLDESEIDSIPGASIAPQLSEPDADAVEQTDEEKIAAWTKRLHEAATLTALDAVGAEIRALPKSEACKQALSTAYLARKRQLPPRKDQAPAPEDREPGGEG